MRNLLIIIHLMIFSNVYSFDKEINFFTYGFANSYDEALIRSNKMLLQKLDYFLLDEYDSKDSCIPVIRNFYYSALLKKQNLFIEKLPSEQWFIISKSSFSSEIITNFFERKGSFIFSNADSTYWKYLQIKLNDSFEDDIMDYLITYLHHTFQNSFDFFYLKEHPLLINNYELIKNQDSWKVPYKIFSVTNCNFEHCTELTKKIFFLISQIKKEFSLLEWNKLKVDDGKMNIGFLKSSSINEINSLISNWEFYQNNWIFYSDMDSIYGKSLKSVTSKKYIKIMDNTIFFPKVNEITSITEMFKFRSNLNIDSNFEERVIGLGTTSVINSGGILVEGVDGHGFIMALTDLEKKFSSILEANNFLLEFKAKGYYDWRLPTEKEMEKIYYTLISNNIQFGIKNSCYLMENKLPNVFCISSDKFYLQSRDWSYFVRPVHSIKKK